jgi:hypothetical protein
MPGRPWLERLTEPLTPTEHQPARNQPAQNQPPQHQPPQRRSIQREPIRHRPFQAGRASGPKWPRDRPLFLPSAAAIACNIVFKKPPNVSDITGMSPPTLLSLLTRPGPRSTLGAASSLRVEVRPPSLRHAPSGGAWHRLMFWLLAPAPGDSAPPLGSLPAVRQDFASRLTDVPGPAAQALRERIGRSPSLRDLWHLRAELYRVVGLQYSQLEAERRVASLNRHFPTRAPRSQFAPLD